MPIKLIIDSNHILICRVGEHFIRNKGMFYRYSGLYKRDNVHMSSVMKLNISGRMSKGFIFIYFYIF